MTVEIDLFEKEMLSIRAQREIDRKDAERYRFLRDQALDNKGMGLVVFVEINQLDHIHDSDEIDTAIDKAMEANNTGNKS